MGFYTTPTLNSSRLEIRARIPLDFIWGCGWGREQILQLKLDHQAVWNDRQGLLLLRCVLLESSPAWRIFVLAVDLRTSNMYLIRGFENRFSSIVMAVESVQKAV